MGFLSSVSNAIFGKSNGPKYNTEEASKLGQYGVKSSIGNMNIVKNADGTYSKNYDQTQNDQTRNNLIAQQLGNINLDTYSKDNGYTLGSVLPSATSDYTPTTITDPTTGYTPTSITDPSTGYSTTQLYGNINQDTANNAAQSYYDQATRLLNQNFDRERRSADTNLINRGIQVGNEQYNQVMGDLQDRQNGTLSDIANQSVFQGQNLLSTMLGNQSRQTANEGAEIGNKNALLQNQNQYLQNQALNTTNEGLVFDNQGKLISNQAGLLSNQGRQLSNEGQYYGNLGQMLANQGQQVANEGNALSNTYRDLTNAGQYYSNQAQQIANANALGSGRDVYGVAALGGNNEAYENAYNAAQYNAQNQANKNQQLLNLGMAGAALAFSDKRLKENLKPVGKLNNGLKVYVGNYKKETGLDTTPQLFLVAQEVQKKHPEAVAKKFGALAVNYKKAVE